MVRVLIPGCCGQTWDSFLAAPREAHAARRRRAAVRRPDRAPEHGREHGFHMELSYRIVLALHVAAGAVGLFTMLPPLFAKKGARLHRRVGFAFIASMS